MKKSFIAGVISVMFLLQSCSPQKIETSSLEGTWHLSKMGPSTTQHMPHQMFWVIQGDSCIQLDISSEKVKGNVKELVDSVLTKPHSGYGSFKVEEGMCYVENYPYAKIRGIRKDEISILVQMTPIKSEPYIMPITYKKL
jgi:hypothetical protein